MIKVFKYDGKWRVKIVNETLECNNSEEFSELLTNILTFKEDYEPYNRTGGKK